jgi:hypothetical protein
LVDILKSCAGILLALKLSVLFPIYSLFHVFITYSIKYRESNLSLDWPDVNLFAHACPQLAEPSLSHPMLAALSRQWSLYHFVVLEVYTVTVCSVVKYNIQTQNI